MHVEVVSLPCDLRPGQLCGRAVAVFDVLRATTTVAAALAAGVREIRLFADLDSARHVAGTFAGRRLLCGEARCVRPEGFDLGNSPGQFRDVHRGATMFMCTTNGTRALLAATSAECVFTAALVNAAAVAKALVNTGLNVTLLCAGTDGEAAPEDMLGAGAVIASLGIDPTTDAAIDALACFQSCRHDLTSILRKTRGGRNIIAAGLDEDIDFAARLSVVDVVGVASGDPLTVRLSRH